MKGVEFGTSCPVDVFSKNCIEYYRRKSAESVDDHALSSKI